MKEIEFRSEYPLSCCLSQVVRDQEADQDKTREKWERIVLHLTYVTTVTKNRYTYVIFSITFFGSYAKVL